MHKYPTFYEKTCPICRNLFKAEHREQIYCSRDCYGSPQAFELKFWQRVNKSGNCWLWMGSKHAGGYGEVKPNGAKQLAHRYAYALTYGEIPDGYFVCHHCDCPACVRPDHLFLGRAKDNTLDCIRKGRFAVGERSGRAKLTEDQVKQIKEMTSRCGKGYRSVNSAASVAARFGVARSTIDNIVNGKKWRHLA